MQLEAKCFSMYACFSSLFQFHIGAIRSRPRQRDARSACRFQFHIGAIRSKVLEQRNRFLRTDFNSILVQLEVTSRSELVFPFTYFNSILVQLEDTTAQLYFPPFPDFNSILVQLEAKKLRRTRKPINNISIPYWCN